MGQVVRKIAFFQDEQDARREASRSREPLLRWSDPTRTFSDASLWAWGTRGRPLALTTMELYASRPEDSNWSLELITLSPDPIVAELKGPFAPFGTPRRADGGTDITWAPRHSPLEVKPIPRAPVPGGTEAARLRQSGYWPD